jgi:hypothetical protein
MSNPRPNEMIVYGDERMVEAIYDLIPVVRNWEWYVATESCEEFTPEEIGLAVLDRLIVATVAAWDEIGAKVLERLAEREEGSR